jgi:hypothetical protein
LTEPVLVGHGSNRLKRVLGPDPLFGRQAAVHVGLLTVASAHAEKTIRTLQA